MQTTSSRFPKNRAADRAFRFTNRFASQGAPLRVATLRRLELPPPRTLANANRASLKVNIRNAQPTKLPCAHSRFRRQPVNQIVHQVLRWHFGVRKPGILKESRSSTPAFGPRLLCDITPDDIAAYQRRRLQSGVTSASPCPRNRNVLCSRERRGQTRPVIPPPSWP